MTLCARFLGIDRDDELQASDFTVEADSEAHMEALAFAQAELRGARGPFELSRTIGGWFVMDGNQDVCAEILDEGHRFPTAEEEIGSFPF